MNYNEAVRKVYEIKEWILSKPLELDTTDDNFHTLEMYASQLDYSLTNAKLRGLDNIENTFIETMKNLLDGVEERVFKADHLDQYFDKIGYQKSLELLRDNGIFILSNSDEGIYTVYWLKEYKRDEK